MMMMKTKAIDLLKTIKAVITRACNSSYATFHNFRSSSLYKVHVTRRLLYIRVTGHAPTLYAFPRSEMEHGSKFSISEVEQEGFQVTYSRNAQTEEIALFSNNEEALALLNEIQVALCGGRWKRWGKRVLIVCLVLFVLSALLHGSGKAASPESQLGAIGSGAQSALQDYPGVNVPGTVDNGLANVVSGGTGSVVQPQVPQAGETLNANATAEQIYQAAMEAKRKAELELMPPKVSGDGAASTNGLENYGLDQNTGKTTGCDPKLAFKAPAN